MTNTQEMLKKLTEEAKQNLANQASNNNKESKVVKENKDNENSNSPKKDLYAEFRDDTNNIDNTDSTNEKDYKIDKEPTKNEKEYSIQNVPSEEELPDTPIIEEYDEPLFKGGPSKAQVEMWKKQYAGYEIYVIEVSNRLFICRTINRYEYKQIVAVKTDATRREEIICETATLWPTTYNWRTMATDKAGIPSTYSKIIMQKSGFTQQYSIQVL